MNKWLFALKFLSMLAKEIFKKCKTYRKTIYFLCTVRWREKNYIRWQLFDKWCSCKLDKRSMEDLKKNRDHRKILQTVKYIDLHTSSKKKMYFLRLFIWLCPLNILKFSFYSIFFLVPHRFCKKTRKYIFCYIWKKKRKKEKILTVSFTNAGRFRSLVIIQQKYKSRFEKNAIQ